MSNTVILLIVRSTYIVKDVEFWFDFNGDLKWMEGRQRVHNIFQIHNIVLWDW
jgi:hypothetical protein